MTKFEIIGKNYLGSVVKTIVSSRAIIRKDNKVLLSYLSKLDVYTTPGGRVETNETLENAVKREVLEETGYVVTVNKKLYETYEYYEDTLFICHYFDCSIESFESTNLTNNEESLGLISCFKELSYILNEYKTNYEILESSDYVLSDNDEMKRGIYYREYLVLQHFTKESN